jgi:hypothetical protein
MLEVGVCPHGAFWVCDGGGCPPLRRFASHKSVPTKKKKEEEEKQNKHTKTVMTSTVSPQNYQPSGSTHGDPLQSYFLMQ